MFSDKPNIVTIQLRGGRGTVTGDLIHANPNFTVIRDTTVYNLETTVPAHLIARVVHDTHGGAE